MIIFKFLVKKAGPASSLYRKYELLLFILSEEAVLLTITTLPRHTLSASLACAISATLLMPVAQAQNIQSAVDKRDAEYRRFDIPAQALPSALLTFGAQSGFQITSAAQLIEDKRSPTLNGLFPAPAALDLLLQHSGLSWRFTDDDSVLIYSPEKTMTAADGSVEMSTMQVLAEPLRKSFQSSNTLPRAVIQALPAGNGDITSLLKTNPAVQFDNNQQSSKSPGEISPADISINGAQFYQNAFLIDGLNMNNDIDPAQEDTPYRLFAVPGRSQGLALDTDLLEEIEVLDSNISAAYGGFNGGVVDARTRDPRRKLSGSLSYQMTRSSWTEYHINDSEVEDVENASSWGDGQPEFEKTTVRATLEGYLNDNIGLLASVSQKRSEIPLSFYSSHLVDSYGFQEKDQSRRLDNYFLKGIWHASERLTFRASATHAPEESRYFRSNIANSEIDIRSGGSQFNLAGVWDADRFKLTQSLGWNQLEQSRVPASDDYYVWRTSDSKPWGVGNNTLEGEFGEIEQQHTGWQYKIDVDGKAFNWGRTEHRLNAGLEIAESEVYYQRLSDSSTYVVPASTNTCTNSAGQTDNACALGSTTNGWPGQYFTRRTRYTTGEFSFTTLSWAAYLEDDIQLDKWRIRPGLRVDSDNYMDQTTFAPRLAIEYDLFGDSSTLLQAGANRYYGRNIAAWRLQEGRNQLRYNGETRSSLDDAWTVGSQANNQVSFNQLDIAYDDELMLGVVQLWHDTEFALKYVNRKGRDQVIQVSGNALGEPSNDPALASNYTTYTNDGRSETEVISLMVTPRLAYKLWGTQTRGQLALDWTDSKSSSPSYFADEGEDYYNNPVISYEGSFMRYAERPADNFTRPWTARLTAITEIPAANLTWSNFFRYRAGYTKVADSGENIDYKGVSVDVWKERDYGAALTWDLRLGWSLPLPKQHEVFINADVFNVLNEKSVSESSGINSTSIPTYEVGRQFWLEVGYRF